MKKTYLHEDDVGQIEILPDANIDYCELLTGQITDFSKAQKCDNGFGWDDMITLPKYPIKLATLRIKKKDIKASLGSILVEYENVYVGYGSYNELCKNTIAYGNELTGIIFFSYDDQEIITDIWCRWIKPAICKLPQADKLLVVSWPDGFISPLSENRNIEEYIYENEKQTQEYLEKRKRSAPLPHNSFK